MVSLCLYNEQEDGSQGREAIPTECLILTIISTCRIKTASTYRSTNVILIYHKNIDG